MNFDAFDITDNGDGTFTLTPKDPLTDIPELLAEYRNIRNTGLAILATRNDLNDKLAALVARRDEIRALLVAAGYGNPDDDQ